VSWLNLVIFLLVVGLPAVGQLWKKLEEKRAERKAELEVQRARENMLRTGRMPDSAEQQFSSQAPEGYAARLDPRTAGSGRASTAQTSLAAQRQARLQELRARQMERLREAAARRQGQSGSRTTGPSATGPPSGRTGAGSTPVPRSPQPTGRQTGRTSSTGATSRRSTGQAPPRPAPDGRSATRDQRDRSRSRQSQQRTQQPSRTKSRTDQRSPTSDGLRGSTRDVSETAIGTSRQARYGAGAPRAAVSFMGEEMSIEDWRRAVVLQEVLAPPVGLRPPEARIPAEL